MASPIMDNFAIEPVDDEHLVPVWEGPIPLRRSVAPPMVWLLGAHGGAGVSTLAHQLSVAGDARRRWPSGRFPDQESPLVLVVASEHASGLDAASDVLRQHLSGQGSNAHLVGLVTVAQTKGKLPTSLDYRLRTLSDIAPRTWRIPYVEGYHTHTPAELPSWAPGQEIVRPRRWDPTKVVLPEIETLGRDLVDAVNDFLQH